MKDRSHRCRTSPRPVRLTRHLLPAVFGCLVTVSCNLAQGPASWIARLESPQATVRRQAARALRQRPVERAVPALIKAINDADATVRSAVARALGAARDPRAVDALIAALSDTDENVRCYSAASLGQLRAARAATPLIDALDDPQWVVREQATWALCQIGSVDLVEPIVERIGREDRPPEHLVWLLKNLDQPTVCQTLERQLKLPAARQRRNAIMALHTVAGCDAVETYRSALNDSDPGVRLAGLAALVDVHDREALKAITALAENDAEPSVRARAEQAVKKLSINSALVGHWSFDGPLDQLARDQSGHDIDGTIQGCLPAPGRIGSALRFGPGKFIEFGRPGSLPMANSELTISAWIQSERPRGTVIARGGAFCGFSLYLLDGLPKFGIRRGQDESADLVAGRESAVGRWTLLTGVVRRDRIELFQDGRLVGSAKTTGLIPSQAGQGMEIGFDVATSPAEITDPFVGLIDDVKIYSEALSASEIRSLFLEAGAQGPAQK